MVGVPLKNAVTHMLVSIHSAQPGAPSEPRSLPGAGTLPIRRAVSSAAAGMLWIVCTTVVPSTGGVASSDSPCESGPAVANGIDALRSRAPGSTAPPPGDQPASTGVVGAPLTGP